MEDEHGLQTDNSLVDDPTKAIVLLSERLANSLRRRIQTAEASGSSHPLLNSDDDEQIHAMVYIVANARLPISKPAIRSLRALVKIMEGSERFVWFDTMGPQVALELATRRDGTGVDLVYANLNHHRLVLREFVFDVAWLARKHLIPARAAERALFNVGASHLNADKGLAVLRGMCINDQEFWLHLEFAQPDYANTKKYGRHLECSSPETRKAVQAEELSRLRDPEGELARYVWNPDDLWDLERGAAATAREAAAEVATQLALWP